MIICALLTHSGWTKVKVVASTPDLASIAGIIGGSEVEVISIAKGAVNPHYVEVLPSYMIKVARANLYLKVGMGLDQWADPIIDGSRNSKLTIVDCSQGVNRLQVPTGKVDASLGDVHPQGNPHYWLDPANGLVIAANIVEGLCKVDPANCQAYRDSYERFISDLKIRFGIWEKRAATLRGSQIVTFHDSWPYFAQAFGLEVVGFIEPKPGIEPTPSHTRELIELMKGRGVKIIGMEPYFSNRVPNSIAAAAGAKVIVLPPSVGGAPEIKDYFELFDTLIAKLTTAKE
jgi:ABC-type Zn uptake system ZnuABC Zn-binding protein ZnuA